MKFILCLLVAFLACLIGKICGMGGGVIIKPVLDSIGLASVPSINFISGSTVIGMTCWSVFKSYIKKDSQINLKVSTPLACGAAIGGIIGKSLFSKVSILLSSAKTAGGIQAIVLLILTFGTLVYTVLKSRIHSYHVQNWIPCILIGFFLGLLGSFLGIGGGPFNMIVLYFFFSMTTKVAAQNSLYIILISQLAGMAKIFFSGSFPDIDPILLIGMIIIGVLGSEVGGRLNKRFNENTVTKLFESSMVLVMLICLYNIFRFLP